MHLTVNRALMTRRFESYPLHQNYGSAILREILFLLNPECSSNPPIWVELLTLINNSLYVASRISRIEKSETNVIKNVEYAVKKVKEIRRDKATVRVRFRKVRNHFNKGFDSLSVFFVDFVDIIISLKYNVNKLKGW